MKSPDKEKPNSQDITWLAENVPVMFYPLAEADIGFASEVSVVDKPAHRDGMNPFLIGIDNEQTLRKLDYAMAFPSKDAVAVNAVVESTPFDDIAIIPITKRMTQFRYRIADKTLGWARSNNVTLKFYVGTGQAIVGTITRFTDYEVYVDVAGVPLMIYRHALLCVRAADGSNKPQHRSEMYNRLARKWQEKRNGKKQRKH